MLKEVTITDFYVTLTVVIREWRIISIQNSNVAYTSMKETSKNHIGCSRHMNGEKQSFLTNIMSCAQSYVTFRYGAKCTVVVKGQLKFAGLSALDNVLLVERLTENLIIISNLCDLNMNFKFTETECIIADRDSI